MNSEFKFCGKDVKVFDFCKIINKNNFSIDDYSQLDDFVFINSGQLCQIGKFVHISSFSSIIGGGEFSIGDFSGLSAGCRIITGSDDFDGSFLSNPTVPAEYKNVKIGKVKIGKHCILGSNSVILPDVDIPDGVTIGAGSIVSKQLEPWGIYVGFNPKKVGERSMDGIIDLEKKLKLQLGIK